MKMNQAQFLKLLEDVPTADTMRAIGHREPCRYLQEHFLQPMIDGQMVFIRELDYSQFDLEDLEEFQQYLTAASSARDRLSAFCRTFVSAVPLTQKQRAFC